MLNFRYRVWDYPIKEQYTHIFKTIKASVLAETPEQGFQRVLDAEDGTFAFIHDASQVSRLNFNLIKSESWVWSRSIS